MAKPKRVLAFVSSALSVGALLAVVALVARAESTSDHPSPQPRSAPSSSVSESPAATSSTHQAGLAPQAEPTVKTQAQVNQEGASSHVTVEFQAAKTDQPTATVLEQQVVKEEHVTTSSDGVSGESHSSVNLNVTGDDSLKVDIDSRVRETSKVKIKEQFEVKVHTQGEDSSATVDRSSSR